MSDWNELSSIEGKWKYCRIYWQWILIERTSLYTVVYRNFLYNPTNLKVRTKAPCIYTVCFSYKQAHVFPITGESRFIRSKDANGLRNVRVSDNCRICQIAPCTSFAKIFLFRNSIYRHPISRGFWWTKVRPNVKTKLRNDISTDKRYVRSGLLALWKLLLSY